MDTAEPKRTELPQDERERPTEGDGQDPPTIDAMLARVRLGAPAVYDEVMAAARERQIACNTLEAIWHADAAHAGAMARGMASQIERVAIRWCNAVTALERAYYGEKTIVAPAVRRVVIAGGRRGGKTAEADEQARAAGASVVTVKPC